MRATRVKRGQYGQFVLASRESLEPLSPNQLVILTRDGVAVGRAFRPLPSPGQRIGCWRVVSAEPASRDEGRVARAEVERVEAAWEADDPDAVYARVGETRGTIQGVIAKLERVDGAADGPEELREHLCCGGWENSSKS